MLATLNPVTYPLLYPITIEVIIGLAFLESDTCFALPGDISVLALTANNALQLAMSTGRFLTDAPVLPGSGPVLPAALVYHCYT
jgi:hypothetical protein